MQSKRSRVDWRGYLPAITTPFRADLELDLGAFGLLLEWLHGEGMHGLIVCGTTGEWTSLTPGERARLFSSAGTQLGGRIPLIAGCSDYTAKGVAELAVHAAACRFDGILVTPPPYVRPSEAEILRFYSDISDSCHLPICVYNWPPGTGIDMPISTLRRLAEIPNVVAIKQSTSDLRRFTQTFFELKDQVRVFGHAMDEHGLALLEARDGDGTMGAGAVLGRVHADFYNHLWSGNIEAARQCGRKDRRILDDWYTSELVGKFGSGPAIIKAALNARSLPGGYVRPPLCELPDEGIELIVSTLVELGVM